MLHLPRREKDISAEPGATGGMAQLPFFMTTPFLAEQVISTNPTIFRFDGGSILTASELSSTNEWPADLAIERIYQRDQPVRIGFRWSVSGLLVSLLNPANRWHLQVYFEQMGGGEVNLGPYSQANVNFVPTSGHIYNHVMVLPPNSVPDGVFDVVAVIRFQDNLGRPGPIAAFAELGKVTVYED
jgi:hypothetical protein